MTTPNGTLTLPTLTELLATEPDVKQDVPGRMVTYTWFLDEPGPEGTEHRVIRIHAGWSGSGKFLFSGVRLAVREVQPGWTIEKYMLFDTAAVLNRRPIARYSAKALAQYASEVLDKVRTEDGALIVGYVIAKAVETG